MLAEPYLQKRFRAGREEGIKEGRRYASQVKAWNERRLEAEAKGEPFDEPMPEIDYDNNEAE